MYDAVIREMFVGEKVAFDTKAKVKLLVIRDQTTSNHTFGNTGEDWTEVKSRFPHLLEETLVSYRATEKKVDTLTKSFSIGLPFVLFSKHAQEDIFKKAGGGGWPEFYKRFPDSGGYIEFSRVGFNRETSQALVYFMHGCGSLCATGHYLLLSKKEKTWHVDGKALMWIS